MYPKPHTSELNLRLNCNILSFNITQDKIQDIAGDHGLPSKSIPGHRRVIRGRPHEAIEDPHLARGSPHQIGMGPSRSKGSTVSKRG